MLSRLALLLYLSAAPLLGQTCIIFAANAPETGIGNWSIEGRSHKNRLTYLSGDYPMGIGFNANIKAKDVDKIRAKGGRAIILDPRYTREDLDKAKLQCSKPDHGASQ